jgi:hypothetical protein
VQNPIFRLGTVSAGAKLNIVLQSHNRLKIAFFENSQFLALQSHFLLLFLQGNNIRNETGCPLGKQNIAEGDKMGTTSMV